MLEAVPAFVFRTTGLGLLILSSRFVSLSNQVGFMAAREATYLLR
jgi:hypothetical protein